MKTQALLLALYGLSAGVLAAGPWAQCGGKNWSGDTSCDPGWTCECQNEYYSQCLQEDSGDDGDDTCDSDQGAGSPSGSGSTPSPTPGSTPPPETSAPPPETSSPPDNTTTTSPPTDNTTTTTTTPGSCGAYTGAKTGYASTTHYYDGQEGACGCGTGGSMASWQASPPGGNTIFTAAGSQNLFDTGSSSWCGSGCGTCYELTNTGSIAADGQGECTGAGETITVMITNLCPANGNAQWCSVPDQYGFPAHFDIMSQGGPMGWNNPVVAYKEVACPGSLSSSFGSCQCAKGGASRVRRGVMGEDVFPSLF